MKLFRFLLLSVCAGLTACAPGHKLGAHLVNEPALRSAHVGISIYDADAGRSLYDHQGDKYFVPASNTKLATCYAALKHLGDSLVGLRYACESDSVIVLFPTADPTLLHSDFPQQPVLDFLQQPGKKFYLSQRGWAAEPLGAGWAWNDYTASFMAERSALPVYGNLAHFSLSGSGREATGTRPGLFIDVIDSLMVLRQRVAEPGSYRTITRAPHANHFFLTDSRTAFTRIDIPFITNRDSTAIAILRHDYNIPISFGAPGGTLLREQVIYSQPTDSLLKPMMHRSDNFFAEQSLLMVSERMLGMMSDELVIDTLLRSDLAGLPQKPRWADGSGLSRYNLFTPQDLVAIINRLRRDFGLERLKNILATGNEGTLANYYVAERGRLWAKTGTLSGVVALSGFLYTRKARLLIFSVLVNNHQASATEVRRAVERFLKRVEEKY